ncbi:hypothetical protein BKA82DRAFT_4020542 [Pisolithus tinctorius]|nr:hypothetical protein BKA82DRAFT_4020542 [Pisolithus tinctorius]
MHELCTLLTLLRLPVLLCRPCCAPHELLPLQSASYLDFSYTILVKVIHVLMFGKLSLTENKCGQPPARGQKMGVLSITEGLIAGACILEVFGKGSQLANVKSKVFANMEQLHTWEDEFLDELNNIDPAESHTPPVSTLHDPNAPGSHDSDLCDSNLSSVSCAPSPVASSVTHFNPPHSHPASVTAAQADLGAQTISGASH